MAACASVLVVGAGSAGSAAAILLAEQGMSVDIIDIKTDVSALGSGITLQGNALRVLRQLGVWDRIVAQGYPYHALGLRAPDPAGSVLAVLTEIRTGGPDLPATLGMYRPDLARTLLDRAAEAGAKARFGTTVTQLVTVDDGVEVTFDDGSQARYDLVIGADGLHSSVRSMIGIEAAVQPTGMVIWRIFGPRPDGVERTDLYYGGPSYIAGYSPTGPDSLYAYIVEREQDRGQLTPDEQLRVVQELSAPYHGPWDDIRAGLTSPDRVNYAHFESHVLAGDWHRGRVVLIGDAAHSCPPTLAQGAAQALEDAAVLAELIGSATTLEDTVFDSFVRRRRPRVEAVVAGSLQLCTWLLAGERGDVPGLMHDISALVSVPA